MRKCPPGRAVSGSWENGPSIFRHGMLPEPALLLLDSVTQAGLVKDINDRVEEGTGNTLLHCAVKANRPELWAGGRGGGGGVVAEVCTFGNPPPMFDQHPPPRNTHWHILCPSSCCSPPSNPKANNPFTSSVEALVLTHLFKVKFDLNLTLKRCVRRSSS